MLTVTFQIPKKLHNGIHRSPVVKFLLKGYTLACHFDRRKNMEKGGYNFLGVGMLPEEFLTEESASIGQSRSVLLILVWYQCIKHFGHGSPMMRIL